MIVKFLSAHIGYQDQAFKINNKIIGHILDMVKRGRGLHFQGGNHSFNLSKGSVSPPAPPLVDTLDKKIFFRN